MRAALGPEATYQPGVLGFPKALLDLGLGEDEGQGVHEGNCSP